jgi:signal transduction histidine kinase
VVEPLRVLLVEHEQRDAQLLTEAFRRAAGSAATLVAAGDLAGALDLLRAGGLDVVLLDAGLTGTGDGCLAAIERVRANAPGVPIVLLTGKSDEELALAALHAGAQDHLVKSETNGRLLVRALRYALERHRFAEALQQKSDELARVNEQLADANARLQELVRLKDGFISRVSHELRTPLAAVYQFATILADGLAGDTTPEQREYLGIVQRNTRELCSMVGELIEASRAEAGKSCLQRRRAALAPLVHDVTGTMDALARAKGITLHVDTGDDLPPAYADTLCVRQVLVNLLDNAIKFTPERGVVDVGVTAVEEAVDGSRTAPQLCVRIRDTGPGLRPEVRDRLFERFYQDERTACTSRKGLGLGLYICKQLVEAQGGRIWAAGAPGQGSTFSFTLPVFALPELLAPVLAPDGTCLPSAGVVRLEIGTTRRYVSKTTLQNGLAACRAHLAPGAGAFLLPEMGAGAPERLLLVVPGDEVATAAVAARLRGELRPVLESVHEQLQPRVAWRMVRLGTLVETARLLERIALRPGRTWSFAWKEGRTQ